MFKFILAGMLLTGSVGHATWFNSYDVVPDINHPVSAADIGPRPYDAHFEIVDSRDVYVDSEQFCKAIEFAYEQIGDRPLTDFEIEQTDYCY